MVKAWIWGVALLLKLFNFVQLQECSMLKYVVTHSLTLLFCIHEPKIAQNSTMPKIPLEIHAHVIALHVEQ